MVDLMMNEYVNFGQLYFLIGRVWVLCCLKNDRGVGVFCLKNVCVVCVNMWNVEQFGMVVKNNLMI